MLTLCGLIVCAPPTENRKVGLGFKTWDSDLILEGAQKHATAAAAAAHTAPPAAEYYIFMPPFRSSVIDHWPLATGHRPKPITIQATTSVIDHPT